MDIEDFEIKIKKYDRAKNTVIVNVVVLEVIELRGFTVRYTPTKHSTTPIWLVTPPSIKTSRHKPYFWIVRIKDSALWQQLQERIVDYTKEYTNNS